MNSSPLSRHFRFFTAASNQFVANLASTEPHLTTIFLFKNIFFAWLFLHTAILLPFHAEIWGPNALVPRFTFVPGSLYSWMCYFIGHPAVKDAYFFVVLAQLVVLLLAILGVWPRLLSIPAYLLTINLNNHAGVILDGGNNLSQLILFYLMFINTTGRPIDGTGFVSKIARALSNGAFFTARLQVALVYFCAGLYKLNGELWQHGMALYYIFQSDTYTHPWVFRLVTAFPWLSLLGTYFTLAFQVAFPILVWIPRARPMLLLAGVLLHVGILFCMGLFTFGLVMCVMYILFFPESWSRRVIALFSPNQPIEFATGLSLQLIAKSLDWFGAIKPILLAEAGVLTGPAVLVVKDPLTGAISIDGYALWRLTAKLPITWLLLPLWVFWGLLCYAGFSDRLLRFLVRRFPAHSAVLQPKASY